MSKNTEPKPKMTAVDIVVERILKSIEENNLLPWQRPFKTGHINWYSKTVYKGINIFLLQGGSGEYLTFNQLKKYNETNDTDYKITKGTRSNIVLLYKPILKDITPSELAELQRKKNTYGVFKDETGQWKRRSFILRYFNVFDIRDISNSEGEKLPSRFETGELIDYVHDADKVIENYLTRETIQLKEEAGRGYYNHNKDIIAVPPVTHFKSPMHRNAVIFHEMMHSTGHATRLNRKTLYEYSNSIETRGEEELIAELGANILMVESGYDISELDIDNSATYIKGWADWIIKNKKEFVAACNATTKGAEFVLFGKQAENIESTDDGDKVQSTQAVQLSS